MENTSHKPSLSEDFDQLYALHKRRVELLVSIWSVRESEDICQEIWKKVASKLDTFDPEKGKFSTWLARVVRNEVRDRHRYVTRPKRDDRRNEYGATERLVSQAETASPLDLREDLQKCLESLREKNKRLHSAIIQSFYEFRSGQDIAKKLEVSAPAITGYKNRGLQKLKECLKGKGHKS